MAKRGSPNPQIGLPEEMIALVASRSLGGHDKVSFGGPRLRSVKVQVHAQGVDGILEHQRAAYAEFKNNAAVIFDNARRAASEMLQENSALLEWYYDSAGHQRMPRLRRTDPHTIHVLGACREGLSYVGLECECAWDVEHGLGFLFHSTNVVAIGDAAVAFQPSKGALTAAAYKKAQDTSKRWAAARGVEAADAPAKKCEVSAKTERTELTELLDSYGDRVRIREFVHRDSGRFWRIELAKKEDNATFSVCAGRIGTDGRATKYVYEGWAAFAAAIRTAINRQLRANYVEVTRVPKLSEKQKKGIRVLDRHYCGPWSLE